MSGEDELEYLSHGMPEDDLEQFRSIDASDELLMRFWEHQYERLAQAENDRLNFTNIIVGASVVGLALVVDRDTARSGGSVAFLLGVIASNMLAIGYLLRVRAHVRQSLVRARTAIRALSPDLFELQRATSAPRRRLHSIDAYQRMVHALLVLVAIAALISGS